MKQQNLAFASSSKKLIRAIIQNLKTSSEYSSLFEAAFNTEDDGKAVAIIRENKDAKVLFDEYIYQFIAWRDSFEQVMGESNRKEQLKGINIHDKLIQIQPKIKPKNIHGSYVLSLMTLVKKDLKFDDLFLTKWRDKKNQLKELKKQKLYSNQPNQSNQSTNFEHSKQPTKSNVISEQKLFRPASTPIQALTQIQTQSSQQKDRNLTSERQVWNKKENGRKLQMESIKRTYESKFNKNKQTRFYNMLKYLDTRRQLNISNKQAVAKEIINHLEKFIKTKIQKMLQIAKVRLPGYDSQEVGDEFRIYSNKSNILSVKHTAMLPESDLKFLKVRYPSKLQKYLSLRVQEQKQEEKIRTEVKQKLQMDKKSQKLVQQYVTADHTEGGHQYENDEGPKRRDRLLIAPQVIQYVIESDSWFGDQYIMEKTFYRSNG